MVVKAKAGTRGKDVKVDIQPTSLAIQVHGEAVFKVGCISSSLSTSTSLSLSPSFLSRLTCYHKGPLFSRVVLDDSTWTIGLSHFSLVHVFFSF